MNNTQPIEIVKVPEGVWPFEFMGKIADRKRPTWFEVSQSFSDEMLNCLPPIYFPGGFMVGEETSYDSAGAWHTALVQVRARHFARTLPRKQAATLAAELRAHIQ